jgi:carboxyl-terminal processing protease
MSDSTGCKVLATALIVAIIMGGLGFASGYLVYAVQDAATEDPIATVVVEITSAPDSDAALPSASETPTEAAPEPTAETELPPTVEIPEPTGATFDLFWEAWDLIQQDFYGELPTEEEMTYGAIRGATMALDDPYTAFIDPAAAEHRRQTEGGSYQGIGALVSMEDGILIIVEPFEGGPADMAGLMPDDIVLQVDDTPIENMSIYEAIALILGPAGTEVHLTIVREGGEPFEVTIVRDQIDIPIVESEMLPEGIGYVSMFDFSADSTAKLAAAIEDLQAQGATALILDLRGNPGGYLNEAVLTAGLFLPQDNVVLIERTNEDEVVLTPADYRAPEPIAADIPMVVLVNGGSASASEIVAGALQDYGRAALIGEQTFGKGSVQLVHQLSNGAELRVTKARWFTPNDNAIHGEGLTPDIVVELTAEDAEAELDPQLDRAVEFLLTGE